MATARVRERAVLLQVRMTVRRSSCSGWLKALSHAAGNLVVACRNWRHLYQATLRAVVSREAVV